MADRGSFLGRALAKFAGRDRLPKRRDAAPLWFVQPPNVPDLSRRIVRTAAQRRARAKAMRGRRANVARLRADRDKP